jgi:NADH-quinone oxidoreductase subunit N
MVPQLLAFAPFAALAVAAVLAMLLAPLPDARPSRAAAALGLLCAAVLALIRLVAGGPTTGLAGGAAALLVDDGPARFGIVMACLSGLAALAFLRPALRAPEGAALVSIAALGAAVLSAAVHAATLFLGIELVSVASIALFVLPLTRPALEAGYKFLLLGGVGAGALLLAFALSYAATGRLDLAAWSDGSPLTAMGAALLLAGLAFKFSLVPFHMWTPDVFEGAPAAAVSIAGVTSKAAVAIVLLRLAAVSPPESVWSGGLALTGGASILFGNLMALRQTSLTRMLGYSAVAHSGCLAIILASGAPIAPEAALFYLAAYAPSLLAALCAAAAVGPDPRLEELRAIVWHRPLVGTALALSLVSLAGLPIAAGFLMKVYLFAALVQSHAWVLLGIAVVGSALGFYYYFRFLTVTLSAGPAGRPQDEQRAPLPPFPLPGRAVLIACTILMLLLGVYPGPLMGILRASVAAAR